MSVQAAGLAFVVATAALALWVAARWPWHPSSLKAVIAHAVVALAGLQLVFLAVSNDAPAWWRFAGLLALVVPALVYTWLSGAWAVLFFKAARRAGIG